MKKLGFGLMRLPLHNADDQTSINMEQFKEMVDTFMAQGFTYFDTAYMYHRYQSERAVKEALVNRYQRTDYILTSKLPTMFLKEQGDQERIFEEQLEKCGVEYFDYYLLHSLNVENYAKVQKFDSFGFVQKLKSVGKIKHLGFSFHDTPEVLEQILTEHPETEFVQLQINYLDWENDRVQAHKCYDIVRRHQKEVIVMEPVKGGTLAKVPDAAEDLLKGYHPEMSIASWAIRYAASLPGVIMVLSGMSNMEQLIDNTSYMRNFVPLDEKEQEVIEHVIKIINKTVTIPCTACQYCVDGCPANINIPKCFSLYNKDMQTNDQKANYQKEMVGFGKASECIECLQCEEICPQHIKITKWLKEVSKKFD